MHHFSHQNTFFSRAVIAVYPMLSLTRTCRASAKSKAGSLNAQVLRVMHTVLFTMRLRRPAKSMSCMHAIALQVPCDGEGVFHVPACRQAAQRRLCLHQSGQGRAQRCGQGLHDIRAGLLLSTCLRKPQDTPKMHHRQRFKEHIGRARLCRKMPLKQGPADAP